MPEKEQYHQEIKDFLKENRNFLEANQKLLSENNAILKKIHRNAKWALWVRVIWYGILIGLPFAFYFYIVEPYFEAFGSDFATFQAGIQEIPGLKGFQNIFDSEGE